MISKFFPTSIIRDFYNFYQSEKRILIYVPILISLGLTFIVKIDMTLINLLFASLSIFLGFLLNLMIMSFNLKDDTIPPVEVGGRIWRLKDVLEEYHLSLIHILLKHICILKNILFL